MSLTFPYLLIAEGIYQVKPPLPFVPGAVFAGRVDCQARDGLEPNVRAQAEQ